MSDKNTEKEADSQEDIVVSEDEGGLSDTASALKKAKQSLKSCEKERKEYLDGWKRAKADALNEKNRHIALIAAGQDAAIGRCVLAVLPILDSIRVAVTQETDSSLTEGIKQIHAQCLKSFSDAGVSIFDPVDEPFDPHQHQSIGERAVEEKQKHGVVVEVALVGAKRGESILRPATVYVGAYSATSEKS